jgi:hypothetical protein
MSRPSWKGTVVPVIRVSILAMGPALAGFDEAESFKQRRDLAGLESWHNTHELGFELWFAILEKHGVLSIRWR